MGWVKLERMNGEVVFQVGKDPFKAGENDLKSGDPADEDTEQESSIIKPQSSRGSKI